MNTQDYNFRIDLVKSSNEYSKIYYKQDFSINATTKEQYLAFKQYIKQAEYLHHVYVAYYMFKHRIGCDFETGELVDNLALHAWLDNEIICKCWKMLWHGSYTYGGGEERMKYEAIPRFKRKVIETYNAFAEGKYEIINNKVELKK